MGDAAMNENELEAVGVYVKKHIADWIRESNIIPFTSGRISSDYEISLTERIVRVEEGIKHQGELLEKILYQMDKRFEEMRIDMDKRFEQVEKRFEQVDNRFKQMFAYFTTAFVIYGAVATLYPILR